jgi:hypothetical protein
MISRKFAVLLVSDGRILSAFRRYIPLREAVAYAKAYNRTSRERFALVVRHPIARALAKPNGKPVLKGGPVR